MIETILKLDRPTPETGLIYPREIVEEALKKPPEWVVLDAPTSQTISMDRVAGRVSRLFIEGDELKAEIELLDTPMGWIAKTLLDQHVNLAYRPGGIGTVASDRKVSDYSIACIWITA